MVSLFRENNEILWVGELTLAPARRWWGIFNNSALYYKGEIDKDKKLPFGFGEAMDYKDLVITGTFDNQPHGFCKFTSLKIGF